MASESVRAYGAAAVAFGAALAFYVLTASFAPMWPSTRPTSVAGVWLIDAISQIPIGNRAARASVVAVVIGAVSSGLIAWIIARRGSAPTVATGSALAMVFAPSVWRQATTDAPGSVAGALVAVVVALALSDRLSRRMRVLGCALGVFAAAALQLPLPAPSSSLTWSTPIQRLSDEWLLPGTLLMASAIVAPLWGARSPPRIVIAGAAVAASLTAVGYDMAALAVFPALLLAHGLQALATFSPRATRAVAIALAVLAASDRWQAPTSHTWRILAWRDAIERALPPGSTIRTGTHAAAALNGPLFGDRPSRIQIVYENHDVRGAAVAGFVFDDLRRPIEAAGGALDPVPLTYADVADVLRRLPRGTIVGLAISAAAAAADPEGVAETLAILGRTPASAINGPVLVAGVVGTGRIDTRLLDHTAKSLHILIGDLIDGTDQRSPADFELRASVAEVSVRLEGRVVSEGTGWAAIAINPGGPLIDVFANDVGGPEWALQVPGLAVWRVRESRSGRGF